MSSFLAHRLRIAAGSAARNHVVLFARQQQSYAALNSASDIQQTSNEVVPVFKNAVRFGDRTALRDAHGDYTYRGLFLSSRQFATQLSEILGDSRQERVAFLVPNDANYVITQWACWMSGQIAVPLSSLHPTPILDYYIKDSDARIIVTTTEHLPLLEPIVAKTNRRLIVLDDALRILAMKAGKTANNKSTTEYDVENTLDAGIKGDFYNKSDALFIYTSGTTGKPKGVVLSHRNLQSQINALVSAWKWTEKDTLLHTLPLHHIHGIVNALLCPLYVGARCVMLQKFETSSVWGQLLAVNTQNTERVNMYMAVPTSYMKLIQEYDQLFNKNAKMKEYIHAVCSTKIRLMISGSAPLPKPIFDRWEEITGHRLLERYGMSETGMMLSNPLEGQRVPGTVGTPLPGVQVRITRTEHGSLEPKVLVQGNVKESRKLVNEKEPIAGDLEVKGDNVFKKYWNNPGATAKEFTSDGWFKTGDTVQYNNGVYKILGRSSVDIIKTGGYKVSALDVETVILGHPNVQDCAVVGLPDITWGQKVAAIVVVKEGSELILSQLREYSKKSLPEYATPTVLKIVDKIPKNNMGKVNKPNLLDTVFPKTMV
ncbi:acyl-CoA synthetase family member 3, mitochondrial [Cephus cinctus]|uniref:Acyl-CoA synthetase family member 3, mitochondrial n=1 Tax=Cephus cinctus TaxID=211228 RepID=A0AAJ7C0V6_CEPCN|nr:acyl-CoA synthetase family member 3, mitochondrial [Cephus cinctus]XP_015599132.1 acyl-CoA synthetase family member 3, mitochondrial [Cephus cinctus]XP_024942645.1 acyl-CoA synthetase family member 3, mitochondrial [Cephus cinctus]